MACPAPSACSELVSLFTREWIEISLSQKQIDEVKSPSLRGSGLKFNAFAFDLVFEKCLPLYEGVD